MHAVTWLALTLILVSCHRSGSGEHPLGSPTGDTTMITRPLQIEQIDVLVAESYPPQVSVTVAGVIPDSCTKPRDPQVSRDGSTFTITILGERPADMACAQVISTYQQTIPLGTVQPGNYQVIVNGVRKDFTVS